MCGIVGVVGKRVAKQVMLAAVGSLHHRGPDGSGVFVDSEQPVALAHARLAIIDLTTGEQPIFGRGGDLVLLCNGELYDHEAIREDLEQRGHRFTTRSDSEIALHLYEEHGDAFVEYLRGEFALVLYDRRRRRVLCARDRFGIKPLYVAWARDGSFVFGSEMKALFATKVVRAEMEPSFVAHQLMLSLGGEFPIAETAEMTFRGVEHVNPGELLVVDTSGKELGRHRYWSPDLPTEADDARATSTDDHPEAIRAALDDSVRVRLRADVPVGAYLSGGLDSALVCALAARHVSGRLRVFCISFPEGKNEAREAAATALHLGADYHELEATSDDLWSALPACLWHVEMPLGDIGSVGKHLLSRLARQHVPVVLTGEGADEVFFGYGEFRDDPSAAAGPVLDSPWVELAAAVFRPDYRPDVLRALREPKRLAARHPFTITQTRNRSALRRAQYYRLATMPLGVLCRLGDRTEMAHSVEARTPFLDHHLFSLACSVPPSANIGGGEGKRILRLAARGLLPDAVVHRAKLGFSSSGPRVRLERERVPSLARLCDEYLSREAFEAAGMFDYRWLEGARRLVSAPGVARTRKGRAARRAVDFALFAVMQMHILEAQFVRGASPPSSATRASI